MKTLIIKIIGAGIALLLLTTPIFVPGVSLSEKIDKTNYLLTNDEFLDKELKNIDNIKTLFSENKILGIPQPYDTRFIPNEKVSFAGEQNDIGYNIDAGNNIVKSLPMYVSEPVDENVPGRGRTGELDPNNGDESDWYRFSACIGQQIQVSCNNFDIQIYSMSDPSTPLGQTFTADLTDIFFISIVGSSAGSYEFDVMLSNQNDADTGDDAGDDINSAISISPGDYDGYLSSEDVEDWYSFNANSGQGIFVDLIPVEVKEGDFDIHLFNPSGELVHTAMYYGEDELEYPADESGTWKIKIDIFPGWDTSKWPDNYFLYGSGAYELDLSIGGTAEAPPEVAAQPEIIPVAQTFTIDYDSNSNKDEYGYLAAIPAANFIGNGKRHVSPIVYQGCDYVPTWFTTVDQTTEYLLDDWNTYLSRHDMTAEEFNIIDNNPVKAAADIATKKWISSSIAVVAVDGSDFEDEINQVFSKTETLNSQPNTKSVIPDDLKDIAGNFVYPMFLGSKWGAIHLIAKGDDFSGDTGIISAKYEPIGNDWWPFPQDGNGEDIDTFYPVTIPFFWMPYVTEKSGLEELQIIRYPGDRHQINVGSDDCSIKVKINTANPSNLIVFLVDPEGNVRRPTIPHYNGGEINPLHSWNGGHWEHDFDEFRHWIIEPHSEFTVEVHNAMEGKWTAIVVPYLNENIEDVGFNGQYDITATIRKYNSKRISAGLSAANAAVLASLKSKPLLFASEDSVPTETLNAITELGVTDVIFVNIDGISSASFAGCDASILEYNSLQEVVNEIKEDPKSENFITITSFGTGDGYFAPAAMMAAYHGSPVLNIGEAKEAYNTLDAITAWREYAGDYYHGARSVGHLPQMDKPVNLIEIIQGLINGDFPPAGLDLKLKWFKTVHDDIENMIQGYGLDNEGKEAYMFVGPRDTDIRNPVTRAMVGNKSFAGHIPVETTAFSSDIICRNILYPAVIYANPGRDVVTSQFMNYPDGYQWRANDGNSYPNYATRENKEIFFSHGRFYEGHSIWDNLLERYNKGACLGYYSGHGTGGSGISAQYRNIAEDFPLAEPRYEHLKDFEWWDSWRGYSGYDDKQTKTCRWGGSSSYNSAEPSLYDIIHFKWVDQLFENLHSEIEFWSSCTTGAHLGPIMYLSHGSAIWFGCDGSAYGVQDDLHNSWIFYDVLVEGKGIGESQSKYQWIFNRDFTTCDPTTLYGRSTLFQLSEGGLTNVKVLYGDPTMTCYNPNWIEPEPVNP